MNLSRLERILLGTCFLLLAVIAYLLGYASIIANYWSTGFITGTVILAVQTLWPSQFKRPEEGGFPTGVDQK